MGEEIASTINQFFHLLQASISFQDHNDMHIESMLLLGSLCIGFDGERKEVEISKECKSKEETIA